MKRLFFSLVAIFLISISSFQISSCTKTNTVTKIDTVTVTDIDTVAPKVCDVRGTYTGTSLTSGVTNTLVYKLQDDNFAVGLDAPNGNAVTFGGYTNTCDSVTISAYYSANNDYYLLQGKLSNNGTTISGTFQNVTANLSGTFTMSQ